MDNVLQVIFLCQLNLRVKYLTCRAWLKNEDYIIFILRKNSVPLRTGIVILSEAKNLNTGRKKQMAKTRKRINKRKQKISKRKQRISESYVDVNEENMDHIPNVPQEDLYGAEKRRRVAFYVRVSKEDPDQPSSYEFQKNKYEKMMFQKDNWELVDIYVDEDISGRSLVKWDNFKRMITDCEDGKIDLIVTRRVSDFARDIMYLIYFVGYLKNLTPAVAVFFEMERLYTLDDKTYKLLSYIASLELRD